MMRYAWLGIFIVAAVSAQDEKQEDKKAELKAVKDDAAKAMRATAKAGSFEFTGEARIDYEDGDGAVENDPNAGKLSGSVTLPLQAAIKIKAGKSTHEIFHKNGHTAERLSWRGPFPYQATSADDVLSLLNFEKLAAAAEKSKSGKALKDEKVGDVECRVLSITLPGEAIGTYIDADENGESEEGQSVDQVEVKIRIGKSDGLVREIDAHVRRSYDDGQGGDSSAETRIYSLKFTKHGAAKVEIPAEIQRQFEE